LSVESPLNPASPQAQSIADLFLLVLVLAAFILAIVIGALTYIIIKHRRRPGREEGSQVTGNPRLEILWTVIPAGILVVVLVYSIRTMHSVYPSAGDREPDIEITAHQWWWEARYSGSEAVTANEIHVPAERHLLLRITSADVIHDFWVPRLARKIDATPGHPTYLWLQVDRPGIYRGSCNEFCGVGHAWMLIRIVVQTPDEFEAWLRHESAPQTAPEGAEAVRGAHLFQERTCATCHAVRGTPAGGNLAPDLTHVASRATLAAGATTNTRENLARWLKDPDSIKPGSHMPNLHLSDADVESLTAYLEELR